MKFSWTTTALAWMGLFFVSWGVTPSAAVIDESYVSEIRERIVRALTGKDREDVDLAELLEEMQAKIHAEGGLMRATASDGTHRALATPRDSEQRRLKHKRRRGFFYSDIESFVDRNERLATLELLLIAAGLDNVLDDSEDDIYTLFAPTNKAFQALPIELVEFLLTPEPTNQLVLLSVLIYHVLPGAVFAGDIPKGVTEDIDTVLSVIGEAPENASDTLVIEKKCHWTWYGYYTCSIIVDGVAKVVRRNIKATNGVIHVIDAVLVPPSLRETVATFF